MKGSKIFEEVLQVVENNTKKTENYLSPQEKLSSIFRDSIKSLYDLAKSESNRKTEALPELITDGFDAEQIWQQLELQNEGEFPHLLTGTSRALSSARGLELPIKLTPNPENSVQLNSEKGESSGGENNSAVSSEEDSDIEGLSFPKKKKKKKRKGNEEQRKKIKPSIVDDKFFKLQELDEYLVKEDKKALKDVKSSEKDSDDESLDFFDEISESEGEVEIDPRLAKFKDFFDQPINDDDNNSLSEKEEELDENSEGDEEAEDNYNQDDENDVPKRVKFNLEEENEGEVKSSLETRQERLKRRIDELEEAAISEKPWQLKGEVDAANRPQNSLLEEHVEFDITSRPAPVITEQTTLKLEDIIRQRIKDKAWDDVERKFKPVETPMEYKKKLILDQEKSKLSLAQIYENEYLKQKEAAADDDKDHDREEEEPKEHKEIRDMMQSLFSKLDSLSNFHYTPKMAKPDIKIVSNLPAVAMEEVAPVATSDAMLLAPEEIKAKSRGELIGKDERTDTDMKRERRKKKLKQREREKAKEQRAKVVDKLRPGLGNKYSKEKASKLIDSLSKERNVSKIDDSVNVSGARSSTAFFNQLQDQVKSQIKSKTLNVSKKKDKKSLSAVKLKL